MTQTVMAKLTEVQRYYHLDPSKNPTKLAADTFAHRNRSFHPNHSNQKHDRVLCGDSCEWAR